jgi:hypothetical protein
MVRPEDTFDFCSKNPFHRARRPCLLLSKTTRKVWYFPAVEKAAQKSSVMDFLHTFSLLSTLPTYQGNTGCRSTIENMEKGHNPYFVERIFFVKTFII